jgi:signal transduction histidine kinase
LRVQDSAPPVGSATAERILERFYRIDRARSRTEGSAAGGAGLGLPIARWVAEAHGGSLRLARSTPDGNEFALLLPWTEDGEGCRSVP